MLNLKGKQILFFAPVFFGYEKEITAKLIEMGASVNYFDERPGNSVLSKAALRLNADSMGASINRYYRNIINSIKDRHYDYVLVVNAEAITPAIVDELKGHYSSAKFVLYMWDSVRNKKNTLKLHQHFHSTYSFDRLDAANINGISFMPLFFGDAFKLCNNTASADLVFTGTAHGDRFSIVKKIEQYALRQNISVKTFLYLHSRLMYVYQCYTDKQFRNAARISDFTFKPLSKRELVAFLCSGKAVLDIQHPNQIGLTMRSFEVMGLDKKLVTTNSDIINYDFYCPENICIINRDKPEPDKYFFEIPFKKIDESIKQNYALGSWLTHILD